MTSSIPELSEWQKAQAALLYHFSSLDYLKSLHRRVADLMNGFVDPLVSLSQAQNRDSVLKDPRWGTRDTTENWCNNAWPFLREFQLSLARDIADRAIEKYRITDTNNCFRGMSEISLLWATEKEEQEFNKLVREISDYANPIDQTLDDYHNSRWDDYSFACAFRDFGAKFTQIPKFQIRVDVVGESGKTPIRTGVYVSQEDPNAGLQFAWTGGGGGKLRPAKTFNDIGQTALNEIGRKNLWLDDQRMFEFAVRSPHTSLFRPTIYMLGKEHRDFAAAAVADEAFVDRPCKWYFVEMINGEFENIARANAAPAPQEIIERVVGGENCRQSGMYFSPARPNSRQWITQGEIAPKFDSEYGETIWQWAPDQESR